MGIAALLCGWLASGCGGGPGAYGRIQPCILEKFRAAVKEANPNAVILAEHYGDPSSWLQGDQWDSVMNYDAFMEPVTWFLTGMEKHSDSYNSSLLGKRGVDFLNPCGII